MDTACLSTVRKSCLIAIRQKCKWLVLMDIPEQWWGLGGSDPPWLWEFCSVFMVNLSMFLRSLMSGLLARDGTAPPTQFNEDVTAVGDFKELVKMWGGGEKGFHMALTLQKLRAAEQKGRREMQWQKYVMTSRQGHS